MQKSKKKRIAEKGIAAFCAAAVLLSGCFSEWGIRSSAAGKQYDYYVHVSSAGNNDTAAVNSSKPFQDIQLAYDALICRWAEDGGSTSAELGIIFDTDLTVDSAFMMGLGDRYGRAHDGTDIDAQTGKYQRLSVNTKKLDDVEYNDYRLTIEGQGHRISPNEDKMWSTFSPYTIMNDRYRSSVMMAANGGSLIVENLTIDGCGKDLTGLFLYNNTYHSDVGVRRLEAVDCTFQNLCAQQGTQYGGGIGTGTSGVSHGVHCDMEITGCTFKNNEMNTGSVTYGGGLYIGADIRCIVRSSTFSGNMANTGGAAAAYKGLLDIDGSCSFSGNEASQRGGTIHDAGTVLMKGMNASNFSTGESGQFGGAVTVISNPDFIGRMVLDDCEITGFTAGNAGGGIYVYSNSELYLYGGSSVIGNTNTENVNHQAVSYASNIHIASSSARVYVGDKTGENGISTSNPTEHKVLVYSASSDVVSTLNEVIKNLGGTQVYRAYSMEKNFEEADFDKISYDSEVYHLVQDTEVRDDMWLELSAGSYIFWDLNIPGIASPAAVAGTPGCRENAPTVSTSMASQNTSYKFRGWYTKASGGDKVTSGVYPQAGVQVYYAQWDVENSGDGMPEPQNKYFTVFFDQNYDGGGIASELTGDTVLTITVTYDDGTQRTLICHLLSVGFTFPDDPVREGYDFVGWSLTSDNSSGIVESTYRPEESVTLYAVWKVHQHTLTWDAGEGTPSSTTKQNYGALIELPKPPSRSGYEFSGWFSDKECTVPLTDGERVSSDAVYYAKWTPVSCLITWDVSYTNGSVTTVRQDYDEDLIIQKEPIRYGYEFAGWYTGTNGTGTRAESYGNVRENVTFYAYWVRETMDYDVVIQWDDFSDNDGMRPDEVTVALVRNGIETGDFYTFTAADVAVADPDAWWHTFKNVAVSDDISAHYVYSVAVKSSVTDEYEYTGDFTSNAYAGYIHMKHSLVLTDIPVYLTWDDSGDNDGYRPACVRVTLTADGEPADEAEFIYREGRYQPSKVSLTGDQNTWTYRFEGFQKYRQEDGKRGSEISYGIVIEEVNKGDLMEYEISYNDYTAILTHQKDCLSKAVTVFWDDSHNQDNKRPANVIVQLYADKSAVANKYVTLSDANDWTYTWKGLPKYTDGGELIHYEAYVVSTLIDYTASTAGMTIRMTYVPKSTSITAYITWDDEEDTDGLRPDYLLAELYADGQPTGDIQTLSDTTHWSVSWENYPYYADGSRVEYTFRITDAPEEYQTSYYGIYDSSGLSAVMTHSRIRRSFSGIIIWDDRDNQASARPSRVSVLLYADGEPVANSGQVLSADEDWRSVWTDLPVYRDGGVDINYSMKVVSDVGKYTSLSEGMTVYMYYDAVTCDVECMILWQDEHDADGKRPNYLPVTLTINGESSVYSTVAQPNGTDAWYVEFCGFPKYASDGSVIDYGITANFLPDGYTAIYTSSTLILTRNADTVSVSGNLIWDSAFDEWDKKPQSTEIALWGYSVETDQYVYLCADTARASEQWRYEFSEVPASDSVTGIKFTSYAVGIPQLESYYRDGDGSKWQHYVAISYDDYSSRETDNGGDEISFHTYLKPNQKYHASNALAYTVSIAWEDNDNKNLSRTYGTVICLTGMTSSSEISFQHTVTQADAGQKNTMEYVFEDLPVKDSNGAVYQYSVQLMDYPENYALKEHQSDQKNAAFTLVNVRDLDVTVVWMDEQDADGKRPEDLLLQLYSDNISSGKYTFVNELEQKSVSERGGQSVWIYRFEDIPVWSNYNTDREVDYLYYIEQKQVETLSDGGYVIDYREYATDANVYSNGNESYFLYLSREPEKADYQTTITWNDERNKNGIRPSSVKAQLYADKQDGNGSQPEGKELVITGGQREDVWDTSWEGLRVYANSGRKIIYTLVLEDIKGYQAEYEADFPSVTLKLNPDLSGSGSSSGGNGSSSGSGSSSGGNGSSSGSGSSSGGNGGSSGGNGYGNTGDSDASSSIDGQVSAEKSEADVSGLLNTQDHIAYLKGYPDQSFRADGNMTRAEAAQMFFNLLREHDVVSSSSFKDTGQGAWYEEAAVKLNSLGVIKGYEDGTFRGDRTITRAEFTAMAVRFAKIDKTASCSYSDVLKNSWMYEIVSSAAKYGWIQGYEDNTFRPEKQITRAEVTAIVNRMLERSADEKYVTENKDKLKSFNDLFETHWAYIDIVEAVNEHGFSKLSDHEVWGDL